MEINKSQKRLLIVLGLVFCYALFDFFTHKDEYLSYYFGTKVKSQKITKLDIVDSSKVVADVKQTYIKNWGRDPFATLNRAPVKFQTKSLVSTPDFRLDAISFNGENSVALINNTIVKNGDTIMGYRVTQITARQVILSSSGNRIVLTLENL